MSWTKAWALSHRNRWYCLKLRLWIYKMLLWVMMWKDKNQHLQVTNLLVAALVSLKFMTIISAYKCIQGYNIQAGIHCDMVQKWWKISTVGFERSWVFPSSRVRQGKHSGPPDTYGTAEKSSVTSSCGPFVVMHIGKLWTVLHSTLYGRFDSNGVYIIPLVCYKYTRVFIYMYIYVCVCIYVCVYIYI